MASNTSLTALLKNLLDKGLRATKSVMGPDSHQIFEQLSKKSDTDPAFKERFLACENAEDIAQFIEESLMEPIKQHLKDTCNKNEKDINDNYNILKEAMMKRMTDSAYGFIQGPENAQIRFEEDIAFVIKTNWLYFQSRAASYMTFNLDAKRHLSVSMIHTSWSLKSCIQVPKSKPGH